MTEKRQLETLCRLAMQPAIISSRRQKMAKAQSSKNNPSTVSLSSPLKNSEATLQGTTNSSYIIFSIGQVKMTKKSKKS
jgi:hypothetical protein